MKERKLGMYSHLIISHPLSPPEPSFLHSLPTAAIFVLLVPHAGTEASHVVSPMQPGPAGLPYRRDRFMFEDEQMNE